MRIDKYLIHSDKTMSNMKCVSCGKSFFSPMGYNKCGACVKKDGESMGHEEHDSCGCGHHH